MAGGFQVHWIAKATQGKRALGGDIVPMNPNYKVFLAWKMH